MTDAALAAEFGGQDRQQRLQRRDLIGAGEACGDDSGGQIEFPEHGEEKEEAGDLARESSPGLERQRADVGNVGDHRALAGDLSRLRRGATMADRGQAGAAKDAEEIRLADIEAFAVECGVEVGAGGASATEFTGTLLDRGALGRGLSRWRRGEEESADVGITRAVAEDGPDGTAMELILLCEL